MLVSISQRAAAATTVGRHGRHKRSAGGEPNTTTGAKSQWKKVARRTDRWAAGRRAATPAATTAEATERIEVQLASGPECRMVLH